MGEAVTERRLPPARPSPSLRCHSSLDKWIDELRIDSADVLFSDEPPCVIDDGVLTASDRCCCVISWLEPFGES